MLSSYGCPLCESNHSKNKGEDFTEDFDYLPNFYSRIFESSWDSLGLSEGEFQMLVEGDFPQSRVLGVLV
eukprot:TRINITY_DN3435_c0_g1_i1.p3 TRINITY_DN3435_c0_g1~~TRINITY_DN3435_c0_g1_i1.p3  ORF type:complete len:70 (-),score=8.35 TRINITY_DN3435_c0_g1_i1:124-333(-)